MTNRERFQAVMSFQPVDRLPIIEWAGWWDKTLTRWYGEGLPAEMTDAFEIRRWFGLDELQQNWFAAAQPDTPPPPPDRRQWILNGDGYDLVRPYLFPDPVPFDREQATAWAAAQQAGDLVVWITLNGFFWFPRGMFGIEPHLFAFHDHPEVMHQMNEDLLAYNLRILDQYCEYLTPDFMTIAEDMSYNHGPMISERLFDEFLAPYYRRLVPALVERGIVPLVDTDGDISELVPWMRRVGVRGFLPLERMAGVDVNQLRRDYPDLVMIGAFDKTVMHLGETRMRQEFERLLPVMRSGGFIPACDHQTPPAVSLEDYRLYLRLLQEYAEKAAR
ncbi:MAG TPA: uroporphyrinogen decarboxylase family protein [Armatimonadota bacterium]|jgi:hypothetical protein